MAFDKFNRPAENLEVSPQWDTVGGTAGSATINANKVFAAYTTETPYVFVDQGTPNHETIITRPILRTAEDSFPCCARLTDASNFIGVRAGSPGIQLYKRVAGTFTQLGTYSFSNAAGDEYKLRVAGDKIQVFLNGVLRIDVTDSAHNTITRQGFVIRGSEGINWLDDFYANPLNFKRNLTPVLRDVLRDVNM